MFAEALQLPLFASYEYQEGKRLSVFSEWKHFYNLQVDHQGLFLPGQCQAIMKISRSRFYQIKDRLECVKVDFNDGKGEREFYSGRSILQYVDDAVPSKK